MEVDWLLLIVLINDVVVVVDCSDHRTLLLEGTLLLIVPIDAVVVDYWKGWITTLLMEGLLVSYDTVVDDCSNCRCC